MHSLLKDARSTLSRRQEVKNDSNSLTSKYSEWHFAHSSLPAFDDGRMKTSFTEIFDSQVDQAEYPFPWHQLQNAQELRTALVAARSDRSSQEFKAWERRLEESVLIAHSAYDNPQNHMPRTDARLAIRSAFCKEEVSSASVYNLNWNQSTTHLPQSKRCAVVDTFNQEVNKAKHSLSSFGSRSSETLLQVSAPARNDYTSQALAGWQDEVRASTLNTSSSHSVDTHEAVPMLNDHTSRPGSTSSSYNKTPESSRSHSSAPSSKRPSHFLPTRSLAWKSKHRRRPSRTQATSVALTSALKDPRSCRRRPNVHVHFEDNPVTCTF